MEYKYFDIHSHLNFKDYDEDREQLIEEMKKEGFGTICIGTGTETSRECVALAEKHENIFASIGIHPHDVLKVTDQDLLEIEKLAENTKVVSIGEFGLDYAFDGVKTKDAQYKLFDHHARLAIKVGKPIMIHCRDAYDDLIVLLENFKKEFGEKIFGNIHFFAGNSEQLEKILALGFTVSFTGVITFAKQYIELVEKTPIEKIMSETDAPYVTPVPFRGKRNSPMYVREVVKKIAEIKNLDEELVREKILENTRKKFKIGL